MSDRSGARPRSPCAVTPLSWLVCSCLGVVAQAARPPPTTRPTPTVPGGHGVQGRVRLRRAPARPRRWRRTSRRRTGVAVDKVLTAEGQGRQLQEGDGPFAPSSPSRQALLRQEQLDREGPARARHPLPGDARSSVDDDGGSVAKRSAFRTGTSRWTSRPTRASRRWPARPSASGCRSSSASTCRSATRPPSRSTCTVTNSSGQKGAWHWLSDSEVHWRPVHYWKPGTDVTVKADINSVPAGNGIYGQLSRTVELPRRPVGDQQGQHGRPTG